MKVLLVIDMLHDFIDPEGVLSLKEAGYDIVPVIREKLTQARLDEDTVVIYLNDSHAENDVEFERFPAHCIAGTLGAQVVPQLTPVEDEFVITKQRYSGFYGTALADVLEDLNPDVVEVTGCCTSICVAQTVADLANRDYKVMVDRKAVADFYQEAHEFYINYQLPSIFGAEIKN